MNTDQPPGFVDPRPGNYYVSCCDDVADKFWLMAGPYPTHQAALDAVQTVRNKASDLNAKSVWMAWGTCRLRDGEPVQQSRFDKLGVTL